MKSLGQIAYEAYGTLVGKKPWSILSKTTREQWEKVAHAVWKVIETGVSPG